MIGPLSHQRFLPVAALLLVLPNVLSVAQDSTEASKSTDKGLPLAPDRSVPINLTTGTWMSLDVSPDGQTIVFDYLGDLFSLPIGGGDAKQLTSGMAYDAQPRFSPDGKRIAYTTDRDGGQNIWLFTIDDSTYNQVSKGAGNRAESPEWLDADYVVASMGEFRGG